MTSMFAAARTTSRTSAAAVILSALLGLASAAPGTAAVGTFDGRPTGASIFTETSGGIRVEGGYWRLPSRSAFFTVVYGNTNCDPAQAFPIGPFYTDRDGVGIIRQTAPNPTGVDLDRVGSVSVRIGDTNADLDGDGRRGPTDVVAVAGQPSVGLVQCDTAPLTN